MNTWIHVQDKCLAPLARLLVASYPDLMSPDPMGSHTQILCLQIPWGLIPRPYVSRSHGVSYPDLMFPDPMGSHTQTLCFQIPWGLILRPYVSRSHGVMWSGHKAKAWWWRRSRFTQHDTNNYCMALNFQGSKFLWTAIFEGFSDIILQSCMHVAHAIYYYVGVAYKHHHIGLQVSAKQCLLQRYHYFGESSLRTWQLSPRMLFIQPEHKRQCTACQKFSLKYFQERLKTQNSQFTKFSTIQYAWLLVVSSGLVIPSLIPRPLPHLISQPWRKIGEGLGSWLRHGPEMVDLVSM